MFNATEIEKLCTEIHSGIRANGFWDTPRNPFIIQGLIASEMFEAFEGLRKNKRAVYVERQLAHLNDGELFSAGYYAQEYVSNIKDSVEAELAGTCIRCFDAIGGWLHEGNGRMYDAGQTDSMLTAEQVYIGAHARIEAALEKATRIAGLTQDEENELFTEHLLGMVPAALGIQTGGPGLCYTGTLAAVVDTLKNMCLLGVWFGIDVPVFVALEVAFNKTRPRKHGKAF